MQRLISFAKGSAFVCALTLALAIVAGNYPLWGLYLAGVASVLSLFASLKILPSWLKAKTTRAAVFFFSAVIFVLSIEHMENQRIAHERQVAVQRESFLQMLRTSDPSAYLAELQSSNDSRYEEEFKVLDAVGYERMLADRKSKAENARKLEIAELLKALAAIPSNDLDALFRINSRLSTLEPLNNAYKGRVETLSKQIQAKDAKKSEEERQKRNPESFVTIENFTWSKEGFGNVMIANFTLKNALPWPVKDILVICRLAAPSGTSIDRNTRTIYERIEAGKTKRITGFNMGFVHSQATRSGCDVDSVVALR